MKRHNILILLFFNFLISLTSCTEDEEAPTIHSVWMNMVSQPVEQVSCAYPGQTICLRGENMGDLKRVIVNGTDINLNTLFVYESDAAITFQLPSDVNTVGDNIRVATKWGMTDYAFIVRPTTEKPAITAFSSTTLIAGRTLSITGENLAGATEVWLPTAFGGKVKCEFDNGQTNDDTTVYVVVPEEAAFAKGQCEIVMEKTDTGRNLTYTEKVYSEATNFK